MNAITPELINLSSLPAVSLANRKQLPQTAGIYFAIDAAGVVQYIGRSVNLRQRWVQHHQSSTLQILNGVQIAWLQISELSFLAEIEQALIKYFGPPLNKESKAGTAKPDLKQKIQDKVSGRQVAINTILTRLLTRKKLTQQQFAKLVQKSWSGISGRKLSRQAVSCWVSGREIPRLSPGEMLVVIEILECTLAEFALAFKNTQRKRNS